MHTVSSTPKSYTSTRNKRAVSILLSSMRKYVCTHSMHWTLAYDEGAYRFYYGLLQSDFPNGKVPESFSTRFKMNGVCSSKLDD